MSEYFWCLDHKKVESGDERCSSNQALGPYPSAEDASHAIDRVAERNDAWDEDDKRWAGDADA